MLITFILCLVTVIVTAAICGFLSWRQRVADAHSGAICQTLLENRIKELTELNTKLEEQISMMWAIVVRSE